MIFSRAIEIVFKRGARLIAPQSYWLGAAWPSGPQLIYFDEPNSAWNKLIPEPRATFVKVWFASNVIVGLLDSASARLRTIWLSKGLAPEGGARGDWLRSLAEAFINGKFRVFWRKKKRAREDIVPGREGRNFDLQPLSDTIYPLKCVIKCYSTAACFGQGEKMFAFNLGLKIWEKEGYMKLRLFFIKPVYYAMYLYWILFLDSLINNIWNLFITDVLGNCYTDGQIVISRHSEISW